MASEDSSGSKDLGVYELITDLCRKVSSKYSTHNRISQQNLTANMRSLSYEIILKKSSKDIPLPKGEPIVNLLSYYFISQQNAKNVAEYKKSAELKKIINTIRQQDCNENKELIHNVLRLLVALSDTVKEDASREMYQRPFSFGLHNEMLPRPERESFGSPQPYPYYPGHVFELPFSLRRESPVLNNPRSQTYTEYTVESFDSRSYLPESSIGHSGVDVRTFRSPMSLPSLASTHLYPFTEGVLSPNYPRLLAPRDLKIPTSSDMSSNVKVSFASTSFGDLKEVFKTNSDDCTVDIWEIASQIDKDIPEDIWDVASKLPPIRERQLIAASSREMTLWRQKYRGELSELNIISERQFIRHIMYLLIGVETNSFHFNKEFQRFYMRDDLILECISKEHIRRYISDLLLIGTYYWRLFNFAFNQSLTDNFYSQGLVYEAAREVIRKYLLEFRILATKIYEECIKNNAEYIGCMPTLLQILFHVEPLKNEIETIASIYKMIDSGDKTVLPHGAELMSYLFNEMSLVTHRSTSVKVFDSLFSICKVYFKFIEKFIFEGELDDRYNEFFIKKDSSYVNIRSKRYWDKGFHIIQSVAIPEFLRTLSKFILLCGKSLRLLRLCNPSDPLVLLISSDHPSIKCCASFEELERQQQVLDVYRTRCLFVSGEPVTFDQILLKREAEKKAFTEIAALKQAETLEKIVAERKRLAQLIIAEKQHSLRVLEAAMAEAKAAKTLSKMREKRLCDLEKTAEKATEEVDSKLVDSEKNRIMEYYSKLNMAVEKSKIHTEWKIKRLQLDQSRIQLLSTEERNLKREKLELEHQKNEEIMAMSIQSIEPTSEDGNECHGDGEINKEQDEAEIVKAEVEKISFDLNKDKAQSSSDVFSAICNVAKSFFGGSKSNDVCDNKKVLDNQGNEIPSTTEPNKNVENKTSNAEIGRKLDNAYDNLQFLKLKQDATSNKQKVMSHEFGQTDNENNQVKIPVIKIDDQNNVPHEWTPQEAAKRNKLKVLGDEFGLGKPEEKIVVEPKTDAQKEALRNKLKVLGVEYNLPAEATIEKEPANEAQGDAIRNKKKVLASEYETRLGEMSSKRSIAKRSGLTLNLKPYGEDNVQSIGSTPNTGALTPGEFFPRLDLETPTTADIPPEGPITCDLYTPKSECENDLEDKAKSEKELLSSDGFNFSLIVDEETVDSEAISETPDGSPSKTIAEIKQFKLKTSLFNLLDGSYSLADMDPFGIKELTGYSREQFSNKMDYDMSNSCYTHPAVIMEEVKKPPYANIFASHLAPEDDKESISCDNIATLSACLQRSVMLPLTYQLEVVNNSILTFFLVNLDMYEHLRSFKDYFFLMDGEFSRSICHNLFTKLTKTLNPQELLNYATLHNILDKALGSSISHVHKFSENLSFTITDSPLSFQHSSPDVLQCLSLTYSVDWPLNILLSQEALSRYAKVFQFLLKMRRIFWVLGEDFEALKLSVKLSKQHSRKLLRSQQYISIQIYRHMMASLIRALDNYIVTTCILTSWREFENDLKKARTLDDLYECHVVYIKKVLFRCLLNNRSTPVMKLLNDIFTVILKFSRVLKAGDWQQNEPSGYFTHSNFSQLQDLFHLFEKLAKYLHKVVTKLMECGYQRHLVELLTMINLNGHYNPDKSKEHNTSVVSVASLPA